MAIIRPYAAGDIDALYAISLATGDSGGDAAPLHQDEELIGHIYSAPYAALIPDLAFVAEDQQGVAGYVVGTLDTLAFERQLERDWWPILRARYPDPAGIPPEAQTADQQRIHTIHHPDSPPAAVVAAFPAHMHMNLLPRAQGAGLGRKLFERWITAAQQLGGSGGVHVGVSPTNVHGQGFWQAMGFALIADTPPNGAHWLGRQIG